jgi:hypothetical protein
MNSSHDPVPDSELRLCDNCTAHTFKRAQRVRYDTLHKSAVASCHKCFVVERGIDLILKTLGLDPKDPWKSRIEIIETTSDVRINWSPDDQESLYFQGPKMPLILQFYIEADYQTTGPFQEFLVYKPHVIAKRQPDACLRYAREALQECLSRHGCDVDVNRAFKPLIDIWPEKTETPTVDIVRVFDTGTERLSESCVEYVALSYCWGKKSDYKDKILSMTQDSLSQWVTGQPLSDLAVVFQDAVMTTRYLGFRYLWIDALCIMQGDPDEWRTESLTMADVYSNAVVTI